MSPSFIDATTRQAAAAAVSEPTPPAGAFYSQHGEDYVAWRVLGRSRGPRYFVEVGMIDGLRFSNTLAFERRGWRGLCVEAHPQSVERVRANRPNSTVVHAAASDEADGTATLYADPRGNLSSLIRRDEAELRRRFGRWFRGLAMVPVPVRRLDDLLAEAAAPREFELLSIDVEGNELAVLRGLDLSRWRPRLIIVEAEDALDRAMLDYHLEPYGYRRARTLGVNAVYARRTGDAWRVRMVRVNRRMVHTAHPVDPRLPEQLVYPSEYETPAQYAGRMLRGWRAA